jgi:hypothetical protein
VRPVELGVRLIAALRDVPGFEFRPAHFDALSGNTRWRPFLQRGDTGAILDTWHVDEQAFPQKRDPILLYS